MLQKHSDLVCFVDVLKGFHKNLLNPFESLLCVRGTKKQ